LLAGRRIEVGWTALVLAVLVVGLTTSEGEPVCEGPFITSADDSLPPRCDSPLDAVPAVLIGWAVVLVVIVGVRWLTSPDGGDRRVVRQPSAGEGHRRAHEAGASCDVAVVRLGALCELESETSRQANFSVSEYAVLDDGCEVILHSERGYSAGVHGGEDADIWRFMTAAGIERDVLTVVLPDDAEQTGDDHPWDWLVDLLARAGVTESVERLRKVPYEVRLGPVVLSRLKAER